MRYHYTKIQVSFYHLVSLSHRRGAWATAATHRCMQVRLTVLAVQVSIHL